jgi:hypothetical protein
MSIRSTLMLASTALLAVLPAHAGQSEHSFQSSSLLLQDLVANVNVNVNVVPGARGIQVKVEGRDEMVARISFREEGGRAVVQMRERDFGGQWFSESANDVKVTITLSPGTPFAVDGFVGDALVGDIDAPVDISATAGKIMIGRVKDASVDVNGSADITLGTVQGTLTLDTSGSGSLKAGGAGATSISISGSGEADIASVSGRLDIDVTGSADVKIGHVDSATDIDISGSGDIAIRGGRATAFSLDSSGSGDVRFAGTAVNPEISVSGSGDVCLAALEGSLQSSGADVTIDPVRCGS